MEKKRNNSPLLVIDLGSENIQALAGMFEEDGRLRIIGSSRFQSSGIRKGVVIHIERTAHAIRQVLNEVSLTAGFEFSRTSVSISGEHIQTLNSRGITTIRGNNHEISLNDVERAITSASSLNIPQNREILHLIPREFFVDEKGGIQDPVGMAGVRLEADVHIVTASSAAIQNVTRCMTKAGLEVSRIIFSALAGVHAVLEPSEKEMGVCLLDIGAGTTEITIIIEHSIRHTGCIGIGAGSITRDIASDLHIPVEKAEELKVQSGSCQGPEKGNTRRFSVPGLGGHKERQFSDKKLSAAIEKGMRAILLEAHTIMQKDGMSAQLGAGVVLSGGGAQVPGLEVLAESIFNLPVRVAIPGPTTGISSTSLTSAMVVPVGLLKYCLTEGAEKERAPVQQGIQEKFRNFLNSVSEKLRKFL